MNAPLNTLWDLLFLMPYRNSLRKGNRQLGYQGVKSPVSIDGTLNYSSDIGTGTDAWNRAIPGRWLLKPAMVNNVPENDFWRINFSRVNWHFDLNGRAPRYSPEKGCIHALNSFPEYNCGWSPRELLYMHEPGTLGWYVYFAPMKWSGKGQFSIRMRTIYIKWYLL